ncbi:hypothetical protein AB6A40_001219 [Gnathostoma spinigerum]|uniref:Spermatogenesis-associated serine-rich protein 2 n=1 Tax=Gnathostoma spinigerum TaxID=75299 RepID=A0ABD6E3P9_9BILA
MSQQYRSEKKMIEEAVAKVREVVHSASKNDIILALHNFDLDVNKTIQAFCDDGAQSALNSWERSGSTANKKKHSKKKLNNEANIALSSPSSTASLSNGSVRPNGTAIAVDLPARAVDKPETVKKIYQNGGGVSKQSSASKMGTSASKMGTSASKTDATVHAYKEKRSLDSRDTKDREEHLESIERSFHNELEIAEQNVRNAFKEIRQLLSERETHLIAELERVRADGSRTISDLRTRGLDLKARCQRMAAMNDKEQANLRRELAQFNAEQAAEEEIGCTRRFLCDSTLIISAIKNFGEVVEMKPRTSDRVLGPTLADNNEVPLASTVNPLKNSASHSSIGSSVGEDSGLGLVSPVGNDDRKNVVEVSDGGIMMSSDALSADQLEELNKKLQESLKAKGIDASVLSGVGGLRTMPVRRRPQGGAQRGGFRQNRSKNQHVTPELSILKA